MMVTLSENNQTAECSSTTPHIGNEREHFVSSSNEIHNSSAGSAAPSSTGQNPHGIWDLANPEIGYELAASSGNLLSRSYGNGELIRIII